MKAIKIQKQQQATLQAFQIPKILQRGFYNKIAYSFKTWHTLEPLNSFDVIHGHGENCFFNSLFRYNTPLIMTFHGTRAMFIPRRDPRNLAAFYAEKFGAEKCDVAVACSNATKEEVKRFYGVSGKKIKVIHNGVDTNHFIPQNKLLSRQHLNLPSNKIYVLWVGLAPIRKGLPKVLETLTKFPNVHLIVVGFKMANTKNVTFLGKVSAETLLDAYNAADFLFFPTQYEGFPVVPMEALSCGLPLVVSKESNMGEIIEQGKHGFVVDDDSYSDKIHLLIQDAELRHKMSLNCRSLALQYSWHNQAEKYLNLYKQLAMC
jgi:glycosyltransferase involved in cell wall biosynthesis